MIYISCLRVPAHFAILFCVGASSGTLRVRRGGGWNLSAQNLRSANRNNNTPANRNNNLGFRLVLAPARASRAAPGFFLLQSLERRV
jgi:hypothetical protein